MLCPTDELPGLVFYPVICARDAFAGITVGLDSILRLPRRPHADPRLCRVPRGRDEAFAKSWHRE